MYSAKPLQPGSTSEEVVIMLTGTRFTDQTVPDSGIRELFSLESRWQRWLDVEAALAIAQAGLEIIPVASAETIAAAANLELLNLSRIRDGVATKGHPLVPLIDELSRACGTEHGGWVHWGATTQNVTQTGDVLALRDAHKILEQLLARVLMSAADLADRGSSTVMAGRTHGQHALPITFGFKVATWIDELSRHVTRLRRVEEHVFVAMMGGAVGNFASIGPLGPDVQARVAASLDLRPMVVPARCIGDQFADYVCLLGMVTATARRIAKAVITLMQTEFGEVHERVADGSVGSSTMPHKRNPKLSQDVVAIAAQVRSVVPLALEAMEQEHEADGAYTAMMDEALMTACVLTGDVLERLVLILADIEVDAKKMRSNLELTDGLILSEAVMLALGAGMGRQRAHQVVYHAAMTAVDEHRSFHEVLRSDSRIAATLTSDDVSRLLDTGSYVGLSTEIAQEAAQRARSLAGDLQRKARHERLLAR